MRIVRTSPRPDDEDYLVVSLDDLKDHLRIESDEEDAALRAFLQASIASVDGPDAPFGRVFVPGTFEGFACPDRPVDGVSIPLVPVIAVTEVAIRQDDGNYLPAAGWTSYLWSDGGVPVARVVPPRHGWPALPRHPEAIRISFEAGPGPGEMLPPPVRVAILMRAAHLYGNRGESNQGGEPPAIDGLLQPYRRF
jgi:uncharacterized phiE125 gp8 family phage protein